MTRRNLFFQAAVLTVVFLAVAWSWCWASRGYPSWLDPNATASCWWGSQAAALTQIALLAAILGSLIAAAQKGDRR